MATELPPPPPPPAADAPSPFEPMPMPAGGWSYAGPAPKRYITPGWRAALVVGWLAVMAGVASFANSGFLVSASPFWLDVPFLPVLPFIVPVIAVFTLLRDWRYALLVSLAGAISLAVVGLIDIYYGSRPVGIGEVVLAIGAGLLTLAGLAGRVPPFVTLTVPIRTVSMHTVSIRTVSIRTATENDLPTLYDVWLDADGVDDRRPGVLPLHAHELRTGTLLVAEREGTGDVIGFGATVERDGVTILADLFVRRDVQAQGIGRTLLDALFGAHPSPVRATMASTDRRARALYQAFGMRERFTNHYLTMAGPWPAPAPLTVCPIAIGDELDRLDTRWYGRNRRVDLDYWAGLGAVAATFAPDAGEPVGFALVCPHTPWHPDGDATRVGPIVARDRYFALDVVRSALAFAGSLPGRAHEMRMTIGSRHPALPILIAAGFTAHDFDVFMSSHPDVVDPARVALTADLL